ncbi:hypothetical protein A3F58_00150 [Candidatus Roizmanbacteria bacterium RIFCSPHIGHO2_12_FULL_37_9b]|uniref:Nucleotidyl transferase domain-containing protein n=1 Tax=Candidatus Roizmanbacteria bacterium RIFCSPHIGHO2_02_FULL_38_11 TaxID=1802039 RepID=A0A1F7GXW7_9BACT|nr:MAG: hypothetical protein A3C25_06590 [Candidatus Roizmanbacteria bacterium RIFCSPHIGHO2_02_FULL_38_11]OGK34218.1 MAG: hypothetical protein A3F58_00150 [Candidatus Roizmanbacteria bacterium RIFCSPHIGHO2_12_FULL_37_9b]
MRKLKNILILAGGDSTRLWPLTNKVLFKFLGKSLLEHQIETYKKIGVNIFVTIDKQTQANLPKIDDQVKIILQGDLDGMAGAVLSAKNHLSGEVLIVNLSDTFAQESLNRCINAMIKIPSKMCILAKKFKNYFPGGYLKFDGSRLAKIIEKPKVGEQPSDIVKLVVDYFGDFTQFIESLEKVKTKEDDQYEQAINHLLQKTNDAKYVLYSDLWCHVKYPWHVLSMLIYFLGILKKDEIKIGKNVRIAKTANIVGPCFIDDNTIVGDYVMIRQSHIGKNCVIGGYSEVTRSYLGDNVWLHRNYIGDSVIDDNISFGAQAATANFRFDGKSVKSIVKGNKIDTNLVKFGAIIGAGSKIGVNTTLLPGIKIGRNTFVAPGETIYEDIEDNMFVFKNVSIKNKLVNPLTR